MTNFIDYLLPWNLDDGETVGTIRKVGRQRDGSLLIRFEEFGEVLHVPVGNVGWFERNVRREGAWRGKRVGLSARDYTPPETSPDELDFTPHQTFSIRAL